MAPMKKTAPVERFRHHPAMAVAGMIVTLSTVSLAAASGWLLLVALLPLVWTVWAWRSGTDADHRGLRVRALLATRLVPWSAVERIAAVRPNRVVATLTGGSTLHLVAVTAEDLPRLVAVHAPANGRA